MAGAALFLQIPPPLKKSDFHYQLPPELIAQAPLAERSASRLLLVPPAPAAFEDRAFADLPDLLAPGDLLVFNDTRVIPARLFGHKSSGGRVEILDHDTCAEESLFFSYRRSTLRREERFGLQLSGIVLEG